MDITEKIAEAIKPLFDEVGLVDLDAEDYAWDAARAALKAIYDNSYEVKEQS